MSYHICPQTGDPCFRAANFQITEKGPDGSWSTGALCEHCAKQYIDRIRQDAQNHAPAGPFDMDPGDPIEQSEVQEVDFVVETIQAEMKKIKNLSPLPTSSGKTSVVLGYLLGFFKAKHAKQRPHKSPCPECGTPFVDVINTGRAGCYFCYQHYKEELATFIPSMNSDAHAGKVAKGKVKRPNPVVDLAATTSIKTLDAEMDRAIKKEDYERAAQVRDRIKEINS